MGSTTGQNNVFTLGDVYSRELLGTWFDYNNIFIADTSLSNKLGKPPWNKSYSVGGQTTTTPGYNTLSSTCRFDMDNDTALAVPRANKTFGSSDAYFGSSQNYGYYIKGRRYNGDSIPSPQYHWYVESLASSSFEKLDYANDTHQLTVFDNYWASGTWQWCAGQSASTNDYTWTHGGNRWYTDDDESTSTINRLTHANDSINVDVSNGWGRSYGTTTNDGNAMYIVGGYATTAGNPSGSYVIRYYFENETWSSGSNMNITPGGSKHTTSFGTPSYGYVMSGYFYGHPGGSSGVGNTTVYRLDYASDVSTTTGGKLNSNRYGARGFSNRDYGYISGGRSYWPGPVPNVDKTDVQRLTFASDTINMIPRGNEPQTRIIGRSLCSTNFYGAQFCTGYGTPNATPASDTYEDNYTAYHEPIMPVLLGKAGDGAYGVYVIGGATGPGTPISTVQRLDMFNDTGGWSTKANTVVGTGWENGGSGQGTSSITYGYWGGGNTTGLSAGRVSTMQRMDYATETVSTDGTVFDSDVDEYGVTGNANYGFWGGGRTGNSSPSDDPTSQIFRFEYSNSTSTAAGNLSHKRCLHSSGGNSDYGYHLGGTTNTSDTNGSSSVDRLDYSSYTTACSPKATLPYTWNKSLFVPISPQHGVFGGGKTGPAPGASATTNENGHWKYGYGSDTISLLTGSGPEISFSDTRTGRGGAAGSYNTGYVMGGKSPADYVGGVVYKINCMSNVFGPAATKSELPIGIHRAAALSLPTNITNNFVYTNFYDAAFNVKTGAKRTFNFGYATGGRKDSPGSSPLPQAITSSTERIDFDNDTAATSPKGNDINSTRNAASVGNQNYGYISGGNTSAQNLGFVYTSYIKRLDYSNDTINTSSPGANLKGEYWRQTGVSNTNYGWFIGGSWYNPGIGSEILTGSSTVNRLNFSSDTSNPIPRGSLPDSRDLASASGNQNYGWVFGGYNQGLSPSSVSLTHRIDYSNDGYSLSPKSDIPIAVQSAAATGTKDKGYLMGGYDGTNNRNQILKYDYVNDSWTPSGTIDRYVQGNAATGSLEHGYSISGYEYTPGDIYTNVNRIDYSSDTDISVGKLTTGRNYHVAFSARENAFEPVVGLYEPKNIPVSPEGKCYSFGGATSGASPSLTNSYTTTGIDRFDFKSGTFSKSTKADLLTNRARHASCGSQTYTWTAGGCIDGNFYANSSNNLSSVERFEYSNDTNKLSPAQIGSVRQLAAQGNNNYGYWTSGTPQENTPAVENSTTYRIDYGNDSVSLKSKSNDEYGVASIGNQDYGWFAGGGARWGSIGMTMYERCYKLDYSNDTPSTMPNFGLGIGPSPYGPMGVCDSFVGSIGLQSKTYGWWVGGCFGQNLNSPSYAHEEDLLNSREIIRHELATDTLSIWTDSILTKGQANGAGTSDETYGYIMGGTYVPDFHLSPTLRGGAWNSSVQRIDFSTYAVYADFKGDLGISKGFQSAWNAQDACNYKS